MRRSDIQRCAALEQRVFTDDPWPVEAFRSEWEGAHTHYVVARDEAGRLVGYAGVALLGPDDNPEAEVHTVGVDPRYRHAGTGSRLLRTLLAVVDKRGGPVFLEVRTDNVPARSMYEKYGFEVVGTRPGYYRPSGADAYMMRRPDPQVAPREPETQSPETSESTPAKRWWRPPL